MPNLPRPKAGIVVCSGEELAEGTVTRLAALQVLQELRPADTVTICLPLFVAGGAAERGFARYHATITVDGCPVRCAARATAMFSAPPAASLVVSELVSEAGLPVISGCRRLNDAGQLAVALTARRLAALVDDVLHHPHPADALVPAAAVGTGAPAVEATGSGRSGLPAQTLDIAGRAVEIVALPVILHQFLTARRRVDEGLGRELLAAVKRFNAVPPDQEVVWTAVLLLEYAALAARAAR